MQLGSLNNFYQYLIYILKIIFFSNLINFGVGASRFIF